MSKIAFIKKQQELWDLEFCADNIYKYLEAEANYRVRIGQELINAKQALGYGKFGPWIKSNFNMPLRTAQRYLSSAELADENDTVSHSPVTELYALEAKNTPQEVKTKTLEAVAKGDMKKAKTSLTSSRNPAKTADEPALKVVPSFLSEVEQNHFADVAVKILNELLGDKWNDFYTAYDNAGVETFDKNLRDLDGAKFTELHHKVVNV